MTRVPAFLLLLAAWLAPVAAAASPAESARAVLYESAPGKPGVARKGTVDWRLAEEDAPDGPRIEAVVTLPGDRRVEIAIYRNTDASLPASHLVEFAFSASPDPARAVAGVSGLVMRASDEARGDPLAAVSVKVSDGFFLMALSGSAPDAALNLRLLGTRDLIDLPIVYASGERAVLALEKGNAGTKAFGRAIRAWTPPGDDAGAGAKRP